LSRKSLNQLRKSLIRKVIPWTHSNG